MCGRFPVCRVSVCPASHAVPRLWGLGFPCGSPPGLGKGTMSRLPSPPEGAWQALCVPPFLLSWPVAQPEVVRKLRNALGLRGCPEFPPVTSVKGSECDRHLPGLSIRVQRSERSGLGPRAQGEMRAGPGAVCRAECRGDSCEAGPCMSSTAASSSAG